MHQTQTRVYTTLNLWRRKSREHATCKPKRETVARPTAVLAGLLSVQHAGFLLRAASGIGGISCPALNVFLQKLSSSRMQI